MSEAARADGTTRAGGLSIEMLQADHGDCLWLEWGAPDDRHRMLIDGGTRSTFTTLAQRFERLGEGPRVDLMVVTHIDADHIDGAIKLLGDTGLGIEYGDVWFNGWPHLQDPDAPPTRGGKQGSILEAVIEDRGLHWNQAFDGGPVVVEPGSVLPVVPLPGGLRLVVLSPTRQKLAELRPKWEKALEEAGMDPEDRAKAFELAEGRYGVTATRGRTDFGQDHSEANGSSIAFIAEYGAERWLFAGDAHVDVLLDGITRYGAERDEAPVRLDGFKLPHHGSVNNVRADLLDAIDCRRFLVSTSGAYFRHPDEACIGMIIEHSNRPELVFNYPSEFTAKWREPSDDYVAAFTTVVRSPDDAAPPAAIERADATSDEPPGAARSDGDAEQDPAPVPARTTVEPGERRTDATPLKVTIHHGSLDRADHPVLVGHYLATPLSGAAGYADRRLDGRITERIDAGTFTGALGTSARIVAPPWSYLAPGAIVVGLGEYAELTPLRLTETVRTALLEHAMDEADARTDDEPLTLGVSSVLLGATGDQGLSLHASVQAVIDGVLTVNRELRAELTTATVRYGALQFFERSAAEAELAYLALTRTDDDAASAFVDAEIERPTELSAAGGGQANSLPVDAAQAAWWRVRVDDVSHSTAGGPANLLELEYSVGGRLARTGQVVHGVDRRHLDRRLRRFAAETSPPEALHSILFELLFPNQLKADLMAAQDIQLEVTDSTADIPWEMLAARNPQPGTRGQLALRAPLVRQLRLPDLRAIVRATEPTALVVGNPPAGSGFPSLPGAFAEASAVRQLLADHGYAAPEGFLFDVDRTPDDDIAIEIERGLLGGEYRIVHIAGHGMFQPDDPTRTGVLIGHDQYVTARLLGQMPVVPDLVFLNCCHLANVMVGRESGATEYTRQRLPALAASLSRQLINAGVRAVVAAGWAVDDAAATAFATTFYSCMLHGEPFGRAVHRARKEAYDAQPRSSTWGAYQCYGDAGYRLPGAASNGRALPKTLRETFRRIEAIVDRVESIGTTEPTATFRKSIGAELSALIDNAERCGWTRRGGGRLAEALARAWAAAGRLDQAVVWFERGLAAEDASMTLSGLEQLANLRDRHAAALLAAESPSAAETAEAERLMSSSADLIRLLAELHSSGERLALFAGYAKRRASLLSGDERGEQLRLASAYYRDAYEADGRPYSLFNHLQIEAIRLADRGASSALPDLVPWLDDVIAQVEDKPASERHFWDDVAIPDAHLTRAMVDHRVHAVADDLLAGYRHAFRRSLTSERASTIDHLAILAKLHPVRAESDALREIHRELAPEGADAPRATETS